MIADPQDTIVAVASPPGGGARGIVRISGPDTVACVESCFEATGAQSLAEWRRAALATGTLVARSGRLRIPCDRYLWPNARSYTRQPLAELHLPGSPPLLDAAVQEVCERGARLAEPGEFTLRAFLAGRIDLTQAEAVLGVVDSRGESQLQTALAQLAGGISEPLARLRESLLAVLAHLEAGLDFVEEDIELIAAEELQQQLRTARETVGEMTARMGRREESHHAVRVVLRGLPNTGKSSLFNALMAAASESSEPQSSAPALVSEVPGTTRDYLQAELDLDGVACLLIDTAGAELDPALAPVQAAAQEMTDAQSRDAQRQILCIESTRKLLPWERAMLERTSEDGTLLVLTKCDQPRRTDLHLPALETSSTTGAGIGELLDSLAASIRESDASHSEVVATTSARCRESLRLAAAALERAEELVVSGGGDEIIAVELHEALAHLGRVVGAVYTDDILDRIFSRFCIGK